MMDEYILNEIIKVAEEYNEPYRTWTPIYTSIKEILMEDPKNLNWSYISEQYLPFEFVLYFVDYLCLYTVLMCNDFSENELEQLMHKFSPKEWRIVSWNENLSERFIEKYKDNLSFDAICKYCRLSFEFIVRNFDILNLHMILKNVLVSEEVKNYIRMFV